MYLLGLVYGKGSMSTKSVPGGADHRVINVGFELIKSVKKLNEAIGWTNLVSFFTDTLSRMALEWLLA